MGMYEILPVGILFAVITGAVAGRRGRSPALWAVLGFLFGPIAPLIVAVLPSEHRRQLA